VRTCQPEPFVLWIFELLAMGLAVEDRRKYRV
jgi:hypothetical protein